MHHDSGKIQAIHSSVTALGLLRKKKEDERNVWAVVSSTPTYHVIPIKLKVSTDAYVQHV